jgi:acylphosphatase
MTMDTTPTERRQVYYSGRVQGVGFRYTARSVARGYGITGFVRNLPDRRVEVVVEGSPAEIDRFLGELETIMSGYIRHVAASKLPPTGEFSGFEIRF